MKNKKYKSQSRRKTPWDGFEERTPIQDLITQTYNAHYNQKHLQISETNEADILNALKPTKCPYCHSTRFIKNGLNQNKIQRYKCNDCGKRFLITTNTLLDFHKIPIQEMIEFLINIIHFNSINSVARTNKNAVDTTKYWMEKCFLALDGLYDHMVFSGNVYIDETYTSVDPKERAMNKDGTKPRGLSKNQICIATITDGTRLFCVYCGKAKPSKNKMKKLLKHIAPGSHLIHDGEKAHQVLIDELGLTSEVHKSKDTKGLTDEDNPLYPVNIMHFYMQEFIHRHMNFKREDINGYLSLCMYILNPPGSDLEKVDLMLNLLINSAKTHRYRSKSDLENIRITDK